MYIYIYIHTCIEICIYIYTNTCVRIHTTDIVYLTVHGALRHAGPRRGQEGPRAASRRYARYAIGIYSHKQFCVLYIYIYIYRERERVL